MRAVIALAFKDLRVLYRIKAGLFFTLAWPLIVAVFFGLIFGSDSGGGKIRVALVDEDRSAASERFDAALQKQTNLEILPGTRDAALALVRQGKQTAAVIIPPGFGTASERMFYGTPPKIQLWIDPSRKAETGMLEGLLFKQAAENMQRLFGDRQASTDMIDKALKDIEAMPVEATEEQRQTRQFLHELEKYINRPATPGVSDNAAAAWEPLQVESHEITRQRTGPRNAFEVTFPQGVLWGIIGCTMSFGIGIVSERTHGTLVRLQMSKLTRAHLLAGKALACFLAIAGVQTLLFLIGRIFFGVRPSSVLLLVAAGLTTSLAFVGIMMLASTLGKTEQAVAGAGWAIMMPISMLGGGMIPLFAMPPWMASASNFSPAKWAILAFEGALWRGFSAQEMLLPCAILLAVGLICFAIGTRTIRFV